MKTVVLNEFLERNRIKGIFQGFRWDADTAQFGDSYFEFKEGGHLSPGHTRIRPILYFTEKDLWDTYAAPNIPYCALYEKGYRSLGAKTTSQISEVCCSFEDPGVVRPIHTPCSHFYPSETDPYGDAQQLPFVGFSLSVIFNHFVSIN